ncbi:acylphosphatase [bacterium BMS3Bbin11]|nr:acylphosphatase [bacterium BMS3Abin11]GBE45270.1 acylphosphatase [bacterium BMS3Bbin11]GMT40173.1 MAG: acylphosphatase [bacterium]
MTHQCCRFIVSGRVQGVFFRASTRDKALQLGLNGWVRNLSNGHVELLACGEQMNVEKLKQWLWQGPKFAKVKEVKYEIVSDACIDDLKGFEVRGGG